MNKALPIKNSAFGSHRAFTLLELLVVLALLAILSCLLLPAMAKTRIKSTGTGCLSNLRQMMVGWALYKDDNNDFMLPNGAGGVISSNTWCGGNNESWTAVTGNTNSAVYLTGLLSPYIGNHIEFYRCPADLIPSANGARLRSYSMNGQMGDLYFSPTANTGWKQYIKVTDLTCPAPKDTFMFTDEGMYSLNDGFLQLSLNSPGYPDCPANYHDLACTFSFADGHVELRKWAWAGTSSLGLRSVPYAFGNQNGGIQWGSSGVDVDWVWLRNHAACKP